MWFWPFTREKTYKEAGLLNGMTDWHTHILPGVDDGVANMDDAVKTLKQYSHMDIREVWLTPHINVDMPNETDVLRKRFDELQQVYEATDVGLVRKGNEDNLAVLENVHVYAVADGMGGFSLLVHHRDSERHIKQGVRDDFRKRDRIFHDRIETLRDTIVDAT